MIGAQEAYKNLPTITFNALGTSGQEEILDLIHPLSYDYSNIYNYNYLFELVSHLKNHFGEMYTSPQFDIHWKTFLHSIEAHEKELIYLKEDKVISYEAAAYLQTIEKN